MKLKHLPLSENPFRLVVTISPHPDDSVISCGGFLYRLSHLPEPKRPKIVTLVLTPGHHGVSNEYLHEHLSRQNRDAASLSLEEATAEKTRIRQAEVERETVCLGVDSALLLNLHELYERHTVSPDEVASLSRVLENLQAHIPPSAPKLILLPRLDDPHPVHSISSQLVVEAAEDIPGWTLWHYESPWTPLDSRQVTVIVSLSRNDLAAKLEAAHAHKSQLARTNYAKIVRDLAELKAQTLREILFGFGKDGDRLGDFVEAYQERPEVTLIP